MHEEEYSGLRDGLTRGGVGDELAKKWSDLVENWYVLVKAWLELVKIWLELVKKIPLVNK